MLAFTTLHVVLSLLGIATGFVLAMGFIKGLHWERWGAAFLATNILTDLTGFGFPVDRLLPSHAFAVLSLISLGVAMFAFYGRRLHGNWRPTYVIATTAALYLNFFVLVVQLFLKVPVLRSLAPTQTEPAFVAAQGFALLGFLALGYFATTGMKSYRPRLLHHAN